MSNSARKKYQKTFGRVLTTIIACHSLIISKYGHIRADK
ncbi:Uncharacterized protein dnm_057010 [Desulfonema magnum]|uniref:Uncharacterized protein n=1 Tax=Desulfonema magnum TaxID=45655 RepID=A0A975BQD9_9BACT|nr:Uncharacterized protein dnm_057010 [Desulfonema magnum]